MGFEFRQVRRYLDSEDRADIRNTLHLDVAVHQMHRLFDYSQTQTGTLVLPGGGAVHLFESAEYLGKVGFWDSDAGIGDGEYHHVMTP
jgi:hypothetical protein